MGGLLDSLNKDFLKDLPPRKVKEWYLRLADHIQKNNDKVDDALAPLFLRHYLIGNGEKLTFTAPMHLRQSEYVVDVLKNHRAWYLTEKPFNHKWVGLIPRLQGKHATEKWSPKGGPRIRVLKLNSLVEIPVKWFGSHTPGNNDLMTSLRGFQLYTQCHFLLADIPGTSNLKVTFVVFWAHITDTYDFDANEHFPVPNPDYKNPLGLGCAGCAGIQSL